MTDFFFKRNMQKEEKGSLSRQFDLGFPELAKRIRKSVVETETLAAIENGEEDFVGFVSCYFILIPSEPKDIWIKLICRVLKRKLFMTKQLVRFLSLNLTSKSKETETLKFYMYPQLFRQIFDGPQKLNSEEDIKRVFGEEIYLQPDRVDCLYSTIYSVSIWYSEEELAMSVKFTYGIYNLSAHLQNTLQK